jgi:hypothetical protein
MASSTGHGMPSKLAPRRGWLLVLPVLYVAGAAVYAGEGRPFAWLAIAVAVVIAFAAGAGPETRPRVATMSALSVAVATSALTERASWAACLRELTAVFAGLAAMRALRTIDGDTGLAPSATEAAEGLGPVRLAHAGAGAIVIAFGSAALFDAMAWAGVGSAPPELAAAGGGAVALFALGATSLLTAGARRLELAAPPRALASAAAGGIGLLLALALAIAGTMHADAATAFTFTLACTVIVRLTHGGDPFTVARRGRRALTLALYGGPVVTLAAVAAEGRVPGSGIVALCIALAAMLIGALAPKLEEPLLPGKGRLLEALADAARAARDRDARDAIAQSLVRLREGVGEGAVSPELWMLHPTRICTVNAAGYLTERDVEIPPALLDVAAGEPEATIRVDVLRALEVRRADLRPLLKWLEDRGAIAATLVSGGEEPDGVLIVPVGHRSEPLTIEEVRAMKELADAFVTVCQARSARARHLGRERELKARLDAVDDELTEVRHAASLDAGRNALASARLARPATIGIYSATSRMAYDALERRVERDAPVVLVARAGIDPVPFIARAHLAGPRKDRPLVIVDGTSSREHDVERWKDEHASPLALADRGLLVLVDGAALPRDVQVLVARALTERRPPWERATPLDVAVALTATAAPDVLVDEARLSPELFARFEDATPIRLPGLHERAEDLFSIVADRLAREGLRVHGRPLGIDSAAFALLVEHPFDGEDAELAAIVSRLVARSRGDVVRVADVEALGLTRGAAIGDDAPRPAVRSAD